MPGHSRLGVDLEPVARQLGVTPDGRAEATIRLSATATRMADRARQSVGARESARSPLGNAGPSVMAREAADELAIGDDRAISEDWATRDDRAISDGWATVDDRAISDDWATGDDRAISDDWATGDGPWLGNQ